MKQILNLLLVFVLYSCNGQNQKTAAQNDNEKRVQQYFEYFNKHDWAKMAGMYTPTADFKDPSLGAGIVKQTHAQTVKKYTELNQIFPNLKDEITNMYPSGDKHIIVEFISTGTGGDGTKFALPICTIFTIENGLITRDFTYFDNF